MLKRRNFLAIDYGEKSVGIATADSQIRIAIMNDALENNEDLIKNILKLIDLNNIDQVVIGYPRNQSGEPTKQTATVEEFAKILGQYFSDIEFQDESLTSVMAENRLKSYAKPYTKGEIDSMAATIILEDYLEEKYGKY